MGWLEAIRREKGYSQKEVAEMAGVSQPTYSNIEAQKRGLTVETAKRIAAVLGFDWVRFYEQS